MRRDHSTTTYRHTNPMMNAFPGNKKNYWYRFQKRSKTLRGNYYDSRWKLGHHSEKEASSTSIHKSNRISVKRQSSLSNSITFKEDEMKLGHNLLCDLFLSKRIKNRKHLIRRGYTTEYRETRYVILERNSNGPKDQRKYDHREKTFSSGARTYVVRRSKETSNTSSPETGERK